MTGHRPLRDAVIAALAGLAWGYVRHRRDVRQARFALLQGVEWFVAAGGAAALIALVRGALERDDARVELHERITRIRHTVADEAASGG